MTKPTTGNRGLRFAWAAAIVLNAAILVPFVIWDDLRRSRYAVEPKSAQEQAAEKKRRDENAKRPKPELAKEKVEHAAKHVEKRKRDELKKKVEELARVREEIEAFKEEQVEVLDERDSDEELVAQLADAIQEQSEQLLERARQLEWKEQNGETSDLRHRAEQLRDRAKGLREQPGQPRTPEHLAQAAERMADTATEVAKLGRAYEAEQPSPAATDVADRAARLADQVRSLASAEAAQAALEGFSADHPTPAADLEAMTTAELYEQARAYEAQIAQQFADAKAAELAAVQQIGFQQALAAVAVPNVTAPDLGKALAQGTPHDREGLAALGKALDAAVANADRAAANARSLLERAQGRQAAQAQGRRMDVAQAQHAAAAAAARHASFAQASQQSQGQGMMIDLSAMMGEAYEESGSADNGIRAGSNQATGGDGMRPSAGAPKAAKLELDSDKIIAQALPGRKFSRSSARKGWLFIDSWYVIGPFENHGKIDFDRRHPPETNLDLDATYVGKEGSQVGWKYLQSNVMRINPPNEKSNSTYYGSTEVFFEETTDMLLAVASDDAAKVWINGIAVWQDNDLSSWKLDEGFRKVRFKKGYNDILVRIENGPMVCYYSLLLCPTDAK